jgi:acyl-CoA synthetase (AMP-forming)/AMP-acid ligase II
MTPFTVAPRAGVHPSRRTFALGPRASIVPAGSLAEVVRRLADRRPERPLFHVLNVRGETTTLTAAGLAERAGAFAGGLRQAGVRPGRGVLLAQETSAELLVSFFGCGLAGAVPCLVGLPATAAQRLAWGDKVRACAEIIDAAAVVAGPDWVDVVRPATADRIACTPAALEQEGRAAAPPGVAPHELAFLQFTSGTTARPKEIAVSHRALSANAAGLAANAEWREGDLMVGWLPLHHDMGLVATTLTSLLHGLPTVLMPPSAFMLRPARWFWALHAFRGTQSFAPNFAYQFTASRVPDRDLEGLSLSSWRRAYNAAEFIHQSTVEQFCARFAPFGFDREALYPAYGLAENTVGVTCRCPADPLTFDTVSRTVLAEERVAVPLDPAAPSLGLGDPQAVACVGRAFPGTELRIVDAAGRDLTARHEGRILVRGRSLFSGYLGDEGPARPGLPGGWFDTGDLGYLADGRLYVTGRTKDLIIKAGQNISPYAIEFAASGADGVRAGGVAALALANGETGTEDVVVVFETARRDPAALEALKADVAERTRAATGIAPDRLIAVPPHTVPKTTSGKVRRAQLRQMLERRAVPTADEALSPS